jgi:hypothetical protein
MRNLVIWNVVVAAVLGGLYGVPLQLVLGRGGVGRTALKTPRPSPSSRAGRW